MKKLFIGIIVLGLLGAGVFYYTHRSVEQELTEDDLAIKALLEAGATEKADKMMEDDKMMEGEDKMMDDTSHSDESMIKDDEVMAEKEGGEEVVSQVIEEEAPAISVVASGEFNPDARGSDALHRGWGGVQIVNFQGQNKVVLAEDSRITNAPDLRLYLLETRGVEDKDSFLAVKNLAHDLGDMKQFSGYQTFDIPDNIDADEITSVVVWCEAFSVFMTVAELN